MTTWRVTSTAEHDGVRLAVVHHDAGSRLPVSEWASIDGVSAPTDDASSSTASALSLILELADESPKSADGETVLVANARIARLPDSWLKALGLPARMPWPVRFPRSKYTFSNSEFRLRCEFVTRQGTAPATSRKGVVIHIQGADYTLTEPYFEIVEAADRVDTGTLSFEQKLAEWGRIKRLLGDNDEIGEKLLRDYTIIVPDSFRLRPYRGADGSLDFKVVPCVREPNEVGEVVREPSLNVSRQEEFEKQFSNRTRLLPGYKLGGDWWVALPQGPVREVLQTVHEIKVSKDDALKRSFMHSPRLVIAERLRARVADPALKALSENVAAAGHDDVTRALEHDDLDGALQAVIEDMFDESEFSDRVKAIGEWQAPNLGWLGRVSESPWLPENPPVMLDGRPVALEPQQVPALRSEIEAAISRGDATVEFAGFTINATQQNLDALTHAISVVQPSGSQPENGERASREQGADIVLLTKDNFESEQYGTSLCPRRGDFERTADGLQTELLPHQVAGVDWLKRRYLDGYPGALLADDMGLGKTLQCLAFVAWGREQPGARGPLLVISPTGLLGNWKAEIAKHLKHGTLHSIIELSGRQLERFRTERSAELKFGLPTLDTEELGRADAVLASYETVRNYQHSLGKVRWDFVVFDEAQKVKNPETQITAAAKALNCEFRIAVTGTPVENRLADLWSIVDSSVEPLALGSLKEFQQTYEVPAAAGDTTALKELRARIEQRPGTDDARMMLRRLKREHLTGLPTIHRHAPVEHFMPREQAESYQQVVEKAQHSDSSQSMLTTIQHLRAVSLHPLVPQGDVSDEAFVAMSARLTGTFQILDDVSTRNEKVLIFLEQREMQDWLCGAIARRYGITAPLLINGSVGGPLRQQRADRFQEGRGFDVMVLSPKAGGVGLTLTAANHVIHLSRWWNPAVEDQCTDRVYRIGQTREVHVHCPLALHPEYGPSSFDVLLNDLLARKRRLSHELLAPVDVSPDEARTLYAHATAMRTDSEPPPSLSEIDYADPRQFEIIIKRLIQMAGYSVDKTPWSHDHGADLICKPGRSIPDHPHLIVQIKHSQQTGSLASAGVHDVLRSAGSYPVENATLCVVTNAECFNTDAETLARAHGVRLIARSQVMFLHEARFWHTRE